MCWFITIEVNSSNIGTWAEFTDVRTGFEMCRSLNPNIARIFGVNGSLYEIIHGGCSCDLYTPPRAFNPIAAKQDEDKLRKKYRRKGWPEPKIERALEAIQKAASATIGHGSAPGPTDMFRKAVSKHVRTYGHLRLFAHLYVGNVADESVTCAGCQQVTLKAFLESGIPPDTLVEIVEQTG